MATGWNRTGCEKELACSGSEEQRDLVYAGNWDGTQMGILVQEALDDDSKPA